MQDLQAQIKKLQLIECEKHKEYSSPLTTICMNKNCEDFLQILCSECQQEHPKHEIQFFQNFKKIMIQLTDIFVKDHQNQQQQDDENNNNNNQNLQLKQALLIQAKEFKILSQQCEKIYELIISNVNSLFDVPSEKKKKFEQFLSTINNVQQQQLLQQQISQFYQNILFENSVQLYFQQNINQQQQQDISNNFEDKIKSINQEFQELYYKSIMTLKQSLIPFNNDSNKTIPKEVQTFFQKVIPNYQKLKVERIQAKFSSNLHHEQCKISADCKSFTDAKYCDCFVLFENKLSDYKDKLVFLQLRCKISNNSKNCFGICQIEDAIQKKFNKVFFGLCYNMWTSDQTIYDLGQERKSEKGLDLQPNIDHVINYIFDGYNNNFFIMKSSDGTFVKFSPQINKGSWTWFVSGNDGSSFQIL